MNGSRRVHPLATLLVLVACPLLAAGVLGGIALGLATLLGVGHAVAIGGAVGAGAALVNGAALCMGLSVSDSVAPVLDVAAAPTAVEAFAQAS